MANVGSHWKREGLPTMLCVLILMLMAHTYSLSKINLADTYKMYFFLNIYGFFSTFYIKVNKVLPSQCREDQNILSKLLKRQDEFQMQAEVERNKKHSRLIFKSCFTET